MASCFYFKSHEQQILVLIVVGAVVVVIVVGGSGSSSSILNLSVRAPSRDEREIYAQLLVTIDARQTASQ